MRRETRKPEEHARTLTWPEAVCALLISVGALLMLDQIFPFSSNVVGLCVQCAVDMALIWAVDRYRRLAGLSCWQEPRQYCCSS